MIQSFYPRTMPKRTERGWLDVVSWEVSVILMISVPCDPPVLLLFIWCHNFTVIKLSLGWTARCPPPTPFPYQGASSSYSDYPKALEFVTNSFNSREAFCGTSQSEEVTLTKATHLSCLVIQLHLTLCDPMNCSQPVSSVHRIFQARILEWVAISSSRGSSQTQGPNPYPLHRQCGFFTTEPLGKPQTHL